MKAYANKYIQVYKATLQPHVGDGMELLRGPSPMLARRAGATVRTPSRSGAATSRPCRST